MKLYISADIEGVCGVTDWNETMLNNSESGTFINQWIKEIETVIEAAIKFGYDEIVLKDAHDTGRSLLPEYFSKEVKLIRGWSGHPYGMMGGLDRSFDGAVFIGYHSRAGSNANPISHTLYPNKIKRIRINEDLASEFLINYYTCCYENVPVLLVSGDLGLCEEIYKINEEICTVKTKEGIGGSTLNENPKLVLEEFKKASEIAFSKGFEVKPLPNTFDIEIEFAHHQLAYKASFYKDVVALSDGCSIQYRAKDYFDILRFFLFVIGG